MTTDIQGTGVALVTPFKNNRIDFPALEMLIDYVIEGGVDFLVALGSTGETPTLTPEEQIDIIHCIVGKAGKKVPVVAGLTASSTAELIDRAAAFPLNDVDAILSASPPYNKPTQEGIFRHFSALAEAVQKPIIIYNVPGRTAGNISPETTLRLANAGHRIIATKEASGSLDQIMDIIRDKPAGFKVFSGDDNLTLPILAAGGEGVISVIANAMPYFFNHMVQLTLSSSLEQAQEVHYGLLPLMRLIFREGNPAGIKALLQIKGIGTAEVRMPLIEASPSLTADIEKAITEFEKNFNE